MFAQGDSGSTPPTEDDEVLHRVSYDLGDRLVTLQEVTETILPPKSPSTDQPSSAPPSQIAPAQEQIRRTSLVLGATVYRSASHPPRSLVRCNHGDENGAITFWSSADWQLFVNGKFILPDGSELTLLVLVTDEDEDLRSAAALSRGETYTAPDFPDFPPNQTSFQLVAGITTPEFHADLASLHTIYDQDYPQLVAAHQHRIAATQAAELERAAREAEPPSDVVIQFRALSAEEIRNLTKTPNQE